jgi:FkbM family methyltransferase
MKMTGIARQTGRWLMGGQSRRKLYEALNRHLPRVLGSRIRRGPAADLRFVGGDTVGYLLGMSEPAVQQALVEHLKPGAVFWDVGAHAGFMTILGSRLVGPGGTVHAFEPLPQNVEVLAANLRRNDQKNVTVHQLALSDSTGEVRMAAGRRQITASFSDSGNTVVEACRADDLHLTPGPTLVKIDVEGVESRVLAGMRATINEHRPVLIIEIHGGQLEPVRALLAQAGYKDRILNSDGMPHLLAMVSD